MWCLLWQSALDFRFSTDPYLGSGIEGRAFSRAGICGNQTEMKDLEIVAADTSEQVHGGQLQLKLPEGINGSDIQFTNDYVTQTIKSAFREQTALI